MHFIPLQTITSTRLVCYYKAIIFVYRRESYLMSNGLQALENEDSAYFLSSGTLTHGGSRDLFSDGKYTFILCVIVRFFKETSTVKTS